MEIKTKSTVDIIQEMILIHTTRKEAASKLLVISAAADTNKISLASGQSDQFISELLQELSNFGDAVQASPSQENEYCLIWNKAFKNIDSFNAEDAQGIFSMLEEALKNIYNKVGDLQQLPESLKEILTVQKGQL